MNFGDSIFFKYKFNFSDLVERVENLSIEKWRIYLKEEIYIYMLINSVVVVPNELSDGSG